MKPFLKFDKDGYFKIVQFTDLHMEIDNLMTISLIDKILNYEKPNLVVITGDIINETSIKTYEDIVSILSIIAKPMENKEIPWATVFGNHDINQKLASKIDMMKIFMNFNFNLNKIGMETFDRVGNYNLLIKSGNSDSAAFNIFMMDSGNLAPSFIGGYNWIKCTQINWYRAVSAKLKKEYGKVIPALMFFHIPLPEFIKAYNNGTLDGERKEEENSAKINIGLFKTVKNAGDVKGIFAGHDHLNNYSAVLEGIRLGYGSYSGYGGYGNDEIRHGARIFLINESNPEDYMTWLRFDSDIA